MREKPAQKKEGFFHLVCYKYVFSISMHCEKLNHKEYYLSIKDDNVLFVSTYTCLF